jgi:hypothetical protein
VRDEAEESSHSRARKTSRCERSSASEPMGFARAHEKDARRSRGSDSGSTKSP